MEPRKMRPFCGVASSMASRRWRARRAMFMFFFLVTAAAVNANGERNVVAHEEENPKHATIGESGDAHQTSVRMGGRAVGYKPECKLDDRMRGCEGGGEGKNQREAVLEGAAFEDAPGIRAAVASLDGQDRDDDRGQDHGIVDLSSEDSDMELKQEGGDGLCATEVVNGSIESGSDTRDSVHGGVEDGYGVQTGESRSGDDAVELQIGEAETDEGIVDGGKEYDKQEFSLLSNGSEGGLLHVANGDRELEQENEEEKGETNKNDKVPLKLDELLDLLFLKSSVRDVRSAVAGLKDVASQLPSLDPKRKFRKKEEEEVLVKDGEEREDRETLAGDDDATSLGSATAAPVIGVGRHVVDPALNEAREGGDGGTLAVDDGRDGGKHGDDVDGEVDETGHGRSMNDRIDEEAGTNDGASNDGSDDRRAAQRAVREFQRLAEFAQSNVSHGVKAQVIEIKNGDGSPGHEMGAADGADTAIEAHPTGVSDMSGESRPAAEVRSVETDELAATSGSDSESSLPPSSSSGKLPGQGDGAGAEDAKVNHVDDVAEEEVNDGEIGETTGNNTTLDEAETDEAVRLQEQLDASRRATFILGVLSSTGLASEYHSYNLTRAMEELHIAAESGSTQAMLALSDRFTRGQGVSRDDEVAFRYLKDVADGILENMEDIGDFQLPKEAVRLRKRHRDGSRTTYMDDDATEWVEKHEDLAMRGVPESQLYIGYRRLLGRGVERDPAAALRNFEAAAAAGDGLAKFHLGFMHLNGISTPKNYTAARRLFEDAALLGLPAAMNGLGVLYFYGWGSPQNYTKARLFFLAAAMENYSDALCNLGNMYLVGNGVEKNDTIAFSYFQRAMHADEWRAPYMLAQLYAEGRGTAVNFTEAARHLKIFVSERGSWPSELEAASEDFENGDQWGALLRYTILGEQGCVEALENAVFMLRKGYGETKENSASYLQRRFELAFDFSKRLADMEHAVAFVEAGDLHYYGLVKGNESDCVGYYERGAERNESEALYSLAYLYEYGIHVEQNFSKAKELLDRALLIENLDAEVVLLTAVKVRLWLHHTCSSLWGMVAATTKGIGRTFLAMDGDTVVIVTLSCLLGMALVTLRNLAIIRAAEAAAQMEGAAGSMETERASTETGQRGTELGTEGVDRVREGGLTVREGDSSSSRGEGAAAADAQGVPVFKGVLAGASSQGRVGGKEQSVASDVRKRRLQKMDGNSGHLSIRSPGDSEGDCRGTVMPTAGGRDRIGRPS